MKTIEEKARAYDEVLTKAAALYKASEPMSGCNVILETLFPELKELNGEKIRKALIEHFKFNVQQILYDFSNKDVLAWLEKQGNDIDYANKEYWRGYREGKKEILDKYAEIEKQNGQDILEDAILDGNEDGLIAETIRFKNEKQSEQKSDKVKPKFKIGDWLINPRTSHIIHIKDVLIYDNKGIYELENSSMSIKNVEDNFRLWTIQDAKDGDVLYSKASDAAYIFKSIDERDIRFYCDCDFSPMWKDKPEQAFGISDGGDNYGQIDDEYDVVTPATKEQRDLLFEKMHEAGYEWDAYTKELKKIEQKPAEWSEEDEQILQGIWDEILANKHDAKECEWKTYDKFLDWLKSLRPQKCLIPSEEEIEKAAQEWESKANFNPFYMTMEGGKPTGVKQSITTHKESFKAGVNWILKSLQDRVQSKQEWSDVDKDILSRIIDDLKFLRDTVSIDPKYAVSIIDMEREITWLNSLKPQNKWKPSDEQMEALDWQVENTSVSSWQYKATKELMEDLKKLKEE